MNDKDTFKITTSGEREIVITRVFDAPRKLVFAALTKPDLLKRWLLGPPGWSMPVCEIGGRRVSLGVAARHRRNGNGDGRPLSQDRAERADRLH